MKNSSYRRGVLEVWLLMAALLATTLTGMSSVAAKSPPQLWLYYPTNMLVNANVRALRSVWRRAAADGYSHILLSDSKLARLDMLGSIRGRYLANVAKVRLLAAQLHLKIVPDVFQVGYSNDLLANDPSLAAGLPVRNVKFIVENQVGQVWPDPSVGFPSRPSWKDASVHVARARAWVKNNPGNSRMVFAQRVKPFHVYHIRVYIRTQKYTGLPHIRVLAAGGASLQYQRLHVRPSQQWRRYDVVFDSLTHHRVNVYFGVWGAARGLLEWRNWHIAVAGLVNVLSRPGAPTVVQGYRAGVDYAFIHDPRLGTVPYPGEYTAWHKAPAIHFLKAVPNGTVVRVSWYYPPIIYDGQVSIGLADPQTRTLFRHEFHSVRTALHPSGCMMSFDEIRVLGWGHTAVRPRPTPGQELSGTVRYCTGLLGSAQGYIWSDMFDPHHNAQEHYYLVQGSLRSSWQGLSRKLIIMNWNFRRRDASLQFFAARGYRQIIAGYYDSPLTNLQLWMASTAKVQGVVGYMYTSWRADYRQIGAFARMVKRGH